MIAVPTEYRGIVFRSKSEAIIAAAFDEMRLSWLYEHRAILDQLTTEVKYTPDFWILGKFCKDIYLEYKPKEPTESYKNYLLSQFNLIRGNEYREGYNTSILRTADFMLLVIDPFNDEDWGKLYQAIAFNSSKLDTWIHIPFPFFRGHIRDVKNNVRFDLAA